MTISEVFEAHGIHLDERQAIELIDHALFALGCRGKATPLPAEEAAIYDAADFGEDAAALARQTADAAGEFIALLASAVPLADAARQLRLSRPRLQQMITANMVWAIRDGSKWMLPAIQFAQPGQLLPGWTEVAKALPPGMHPLEVLGFLTTPQPELQLSGRPCSVVEWLRSGGDPAAAVQVTATLASVGM